ncbi:TRAP transporter substrate-binding protein [Bosea lathyri]|uniref:TRAP-type C4-dicarboxylate transport system, substrate-binding protein n=1 Tax=Bosea lathyri TaxID=1036778 RepID=A0A1H6D915_9HYPH|nr:TRAP transporter substrate-binding protein [Bosea lathyri]SEG81977.1 TRAP-type C4-dicarboxylate transport system, substrate-binding protein [Bosea lathyri]
MTRISRQTLYGLAGAIALFLCPATSPAQSQEKPIQLKISLFVPPAHPLVPSAKEWAESLKKASGGSITTTIFPAEQLGKAFDQYDMVSNGIADVALVSPGYQPGRFPIINAAQLPFMVANADGGSAAVDEWYRKYASREMSDTHFCMAFVHDPGTLHSRKKIVLPGDVRGLKVRPAQQAIGELITTLGGTNIQASAPESRDALERGVADAITFPWNSIFLFGIDKVAKYSLDAPLYTTSYTWSVNKAVYDRASAPQKKVIDDHCTADWAVRISHAWTVFEAEGRQKMRKASGHEITELTPDQLKQWRDAAAPLAMNWANAVRAKGLDPDAVLTELRQKLSDRKAIY